MEGAYILQNPDRPLYYVVGRSVWRQPVGRENHDGSTNWSLGFKVCTVMDGVMPASVAEMLTAAETQLPD